MAKAQRDKGKRGERDVINLLQPHVDFIYNAMRGAQTALMASVETPELKRNQLQSDGGGNDIHGLHWLSLEVKNQQALSVESWWAQTLAQVKVGQVPVLMYKHRAKWHCVVLARVDGMADALRITMSVNEFGYWFRFTLWQQLWQELQLLKIKGSK